MKLLKKTGKLLFTAGMCVYAFCLINGINGNIVGAEMKFADYENGNYTLVSKSAAIDKGHSLPWMESSADFTPLRSRSTTKDFERRRS